jgi:hypothetical protein
MIFPRYVQEGRDATCDLPEISSLNIEYKKGHSEYSLGSQGGIHMPIPGNQAIR